jgi:hypothetical protein
MPLAATELALNALFAFSPPRINSGLIASSSFDSRCSVYTSSMVRRTIRPARSPPACRLVRPFLMMTMFLPSSSSTR